MEKQQAEPTQQAISCLVTLHQVRLPSDLLEFHSCYPLGCQAAQSFNPRSFMTDWNLFVWPWFFCCCFFFSLSLSLQIIMQTNKNIALLLTKWIYMELSAKENSYQCLPISDGKSTLHMLKARFPADVQWSSPSLCKQGSWPRGGSVCLQQSVGPGNDGYLGGKECQHCARIL